MRTYIGVYLASLVSALAITPLVIRLARRINAIDVPGVRSIHTKPIPRIGGMAIFLSAMSVIVSVLFLDNRIGEAFRAVRWELGSLLCMATFIFLVGFLDDLRNLPARVKLVAELVAAAVLCHAGVEITSLDVPGASVLRFGALSCPVTILWIVGIANAVNLSDGLDGLAAGVSAIACGVIAIFALYSGNMIMAVFMLALLGSLTGFLVFNFNPAKTFMGDCGSLFLGFTIASSSVMCLTKSSALVGLALPTLALGIPIFDTLFAILRRFLERRSLFAPDRSHFHHRLIDLGLEPRHAVIAIYAATCLATGLGLFMMIRRDIGALLVFACILALLILLFRIVGAVCVGEILLGLQKNHLLTQCRKRENIAFENLQLHFREAKTSLQKWQAVCEAADRLEFAWLSLCVAGADGRTETSIWRRPGVRPEPSHIITVTVSLPARGRLPGKMVEFEMAVLTNGSFESASHRVGLFGRLVEENTCVDDRDTAARAVV